MEPKIRVEQEKARRGGAPEHWQITWRVENLGEASLKILSARAPHGKFRCKEKEWMPAVDLPSNQSARIELEVRCGEPPGAIIENAFLILRVLLNGIPWLVLARLRVAVGCDRAPTTATELITIQPVGFSLQRADT